MTQSYRCVCTFKRWMFWNSGPTRPELPRTAEEGGDRAWEGGPDSSLGWKTGQPGASTLTSLGRKQKESWARRQSLGSIPDPTCYPAAFVSPASVSSVFTGGNLGVSGEGGEAMFVPSAGYWLAPQSSLSPIHCEGRLCYIPGIFECLLWQACPNHFTVLIHLIFTTILRITNLHYPPFTGKKEQRG